MTANTRIYAPHKTGQLLNERFSRLSAKGPDSLYAAEFSVGPSLQHASHPHLPLHTPFISHPLAISDLISHPPPAAATVYPPTQAAARAASSSHHTQQLYQPPPQRSQQLQVQQLPPAGMNQQLTRELSQRASVQLELTAAGVVPPSAARSAVDRRPVRQRLSVKARLGGRALQSTGVKQRLQLPTPVARGKSVAAGARRLGALPVAPTAAAAVRTRPAANFRGRGRVARPLVARGGIHRAEDADTIRHELDQQLDEYMEAAK